MADLEDLAELTRRFRDQTETMSTRAPFTARLSRAIADLPDVVALLRSAPPEQQLPVLLLAAIHHDVLGDPHCELAAWYPNITADPRTDDVTPALRRHCAERAEAITDTVTTRSTQTNEVGRCGFFLPALGLIADEVGALSLVDVGASAGLNLFPDRYEYRYEPGGAVGGPSDVRITVGTRGAVPVPRRLPVIAGRVGLDRSPIDVSDVASTRWLQACVWPDQADRFHRLEAALAIARRDPPDIRSDDAVGGLADAIHAAGATGGHPVVLNSWVLNYLPVDRRRAYVAELDRIGGERDITWVFGESPDQAAGLPFPASLAGEEVTALMLVRWRHGERTVDHLGVAHPHGYWLHWAD